MMAAIYTPQTKYPNWSLISDTEDTASQTTIGYFLSNASRLIVTFTACIPIGKLDSFIYSFKIIKPRSALFQVLPSIKLICNNTLMIVQPILAL